MFVNAPTKIDVSKGAGALLHLLSSGKLQLVVEKDELYERAQDRRRKLQSKAAPDRQLLQETAEMLLCSSEPLCLPVWMRASLSRQFKLESCVFHETCESSSFDVTGPRNGAMSSRCDGVTFAQGQRIALRMRWIKPSLFGCSSAQTSFNVVVPCCAAMLCLR